MLDHIPCDQVINCIFLFPTIERMADSPKGKIVTPALKYLRWLAPVLIQPLLYIIPSFLVNWILNWHFRHCKTKDVAISGTEKLLRHPSMSNILNMAHEEMQTVTSVDYNLLDKHMSKLMFYYGGDDHWCPVQYYEDMISKYPNGKIILCKENIAHAFVLNDGVKMATVLWDWMELHI